MFESISIDSVPPVPSVIATAAESVATKVFARCPPKVGFLSFVIAPVAKRCRSQREVAVQSWILEPCWNCFLGKCAQSARNQRAAAGGGLLHRSRICDHDPVVVGAVLPASRFRSVPEQQEKNDDGDRNSKQPEKDRHN